MNIARVPSPSRPANGGQAYLWWICIRTLLLFAIALLPIVVAGIALLMSAREKSMTAREPVPDEMSEATASNEVPEATASPATD